MYTRRHIPVIVAHRANSRRRIKHYIFNSIVDAIEMDFVKSPTNGGIVLQHVDEDYVIRDFIIKNESEFLDNVKLGFNVRYYAKKLKSWITDTLTHKRCNKKPRKYYLENILSFIDEQLRKANRNMTIIIDLKAKGVAKELAKTLTNTPIHNATIYISSKYHSELAKIKQLAPHVKVLASFDGEPVNVSEYLKSLDMDGASVRAAFVDKSLVNDLHKHGFVLAVWTVNDLGMARHLARLGVDMIITDIPEVIRKVLELDEEYRSMQDEINLDRYAEQSEDRIVLGGLEHMFGYELGHQNEFEEEKKKRRSSI